MQLGALGPASVSCHGWHLPWGSSCCRRPKACFVRCFAAVDDSGRNFDFVRSAIARNSVPTMPPSARLADEIEEENNKGPRELHCN